MTSRRGEMADYSFTSHNLVGGTSISDSTDNAPYKVSEHVLWAPRKMRVGSIGAGMSGIMMCYKKEKEFGDSVDLVVYEKNAACGGVWYTNRYPGCRCDVPSHQYQFSFAPNPEWSSYYSTAEEIQAYFQNFAEKQGYIGKYIKLQHHVTKAVWHEEKGQWQLFVREMNGPHFVRDFEDYVDFLVGSFGILNTWKWPDIPNRESFKGHMIHSANYDASLNLKDLRVAVIGSGPTASQIVPSICETAKQVVSVSRTPQWVVKEIGLKGNDDITGHNFQYKDSEKQRERFRDDPAYYLHYKKTMEDKSNSKFMLFIENHVSQQIGRQMVERQMKSILNGKEHLKKRMIPDYSLGCRRIVRSEGFLEAFLKENVILVEGDVTFTQDGLKTTSGVCYDVDVIICATGFDMSFKQHFPIIGRGGISLDDTWEKNTEAYLAMAVPGFPNLMIGSLGPNCPASTGSFTCAVEAAQDYICKVIRKMQTENMKSIDVRPGVLREYNEHVHEWLRRSVWSSGCKSVYNQGNATGKLTMQYPGSIVHWRKLLEEPRFEDYSFVHRSRNRFEFMGNGFTEAEVTGGDLSWYLNPEYIEKPLFTH